MLRTLLRLQRTGSSFTSRHHPSISSLFFICSPSLEGTNVATCSPVSGSHFLLCHLFSSASSLATLGSSSVTEDGGKQSFTVSYLINTCGFPVEKALSASKYFRVENPENADSVLAFLKNNGFTPIQITYLTRRSPYVLASSIKNTLLPKVDFFHSKGFSRAEIAKILSLSPEIFRRSLENQIIPSFNFFRNFLNTDEEVVVPIMRFPKLLLYDLRTYAKPNVAVLKKFGVPDSNIAHLLKRQPRAVMIPTSNFEVIVDQVKKMGFDPLRKNFVLAIHALRAMSKLTWDKKLKTYKRWGWSEKEVIAAFRKQPWCMMVSEEKIVSVMDFIVNKMGWQTSLLAQAPVIFSLSLEKRVIPRSLVYQLLLSRKSGKLAINYGLFVQAPEEQFVKKIQKYYRDNASELLNIYQEKLNLSK